MAEDKKIIVDDDWKKQAQKEKEDMKTQAEKEKAQPKSDQPLPKGDILTLISMLATQALFSMGLIGEEGSEPKKDLKMAKFNIDLLEALEEKTKGNLSDDEAKVLGDALSQLKMSFVNLSG